MSLLSKIHDEFTALRQRAHELVNPAETIEKKLHEVVDSIVAHVHELEASIGALETRVHDSISNKTDAAVVAVRGEVKPVDELVAAPAAPATPAANASRSIIAGLEAGHENDAPRVDAPAQTGAPADYTGHELTRGHPRINVEQAGVYAEYHFEGPGTVYYEICAGCDSGMRVTSYIADASGGVISETETRVIMNKQPFPVTATGPCTFFVKPEATGPISVGLE